MKWTQFYLLVVLFLPLTAQAKTKWVAPDFAIFPIASSELKQAFVNNQQTCRSSIESAVCLVDPPKEGTEFGQPRPCLEGSASYVKAFEDVYDQLPGYFQEMFCHIKKIYIEKEFIGSAYGGLLTDEAKPEIILGGVLGLRKSLLDQPLSLDEWASWKEQLHFGVEPGHVNYRNDLPVVHTNMTNQSTGMLYFLVAHEFGHIFDFTNKLNEGGSWQSLSWKDADVPLDVFEFPLRKSLCFYFCEGNYIKAERQDELYRSLVGTNFLSAYTTRYSAEDFADTLAFYALMTDKNASYQITTASGMVYDALERLRSDPLLLSKKQYLENFLQSDYKYPGAVM